MDGNDTVRRLALPFSPAKDTPVIRRIAPRNFSGIFMIFSLLLTRFLCGAGALAREMPGTKKIRGTGPSGRLGEA
jgi:hypothetical protein